MAKKVAKTRPLSQQHRRFIAAYRRLRNATRSYLEVYPRSTQNTADSEGSRLLGDPRISQEIERLDSDALKRRHMSADEALAITANLARVNLKEFYWAPGDLDSHGQPTQEGTRKPLHELTDEQARMIAGFKRVKGGIDMVFRDADLSLGHILKHHKLLSDKVELSGPDGRPIVLKWDDSENAPQS